MAFTKKLATLLLALTMSLSLVSIGALADDAVPPVEAPATFRAWSYDFEGGNCHSLSQYDATVYEDISGWQIHFTGVFGKLARLTVSDINAMAAAELASAPEGVKLASAYITQQSDSAANVWEDPVYLDVQDGLVTADAQASLDAQLMRSGLETRLHLTWELPAAPPVDPVVPPVDPPVDPIVPPVDPIVPPVDPIVPPVDPIVPPVFRPEEIIIPEPVPEAPAPEEIITPDEEIIVPDDVPLDDSPKTGDGSDITVLWLVFSVSLCGLVLLVLTAPKKRNDK